MLNILKSAHRKIMEITPFHEAVSNWKNILNTKCRSSESTVCMRWIWSVSWGSLAIASLEFWQSPTLYTVSPVLHERWCGMWVQRNSHSSGSIIGNHLHFGTPVLSKYRKSQKCIPKWDCASHNCSSRPFCHFSCPSPTSWCIAFALTALECNQMYVL